MMPGALKQMNCFIETISNLTFESTGILNVGPYAPRSPNPLWWLGTHIRGPQVTTLEKIYFAVRVPRTTTPIFISQTTTKKKVALDKVFRCPH